MRIVSLLILTIFLFAFYQTTKSPHGSGFKVSCKTCHSSKGWVLDKEIYSFNHNSTRFPLAGQHKTLNCRQCHVSLVFSEAKSECSDCHRDIHESTAGPDCSRCHNAGSWLVSDITGIHRMGRFPLLGPHRTADCRQCHKSENPLRFDVIGADCIDCHRAEYLSTNNPNHAQAGFSEECSSCHNVNSFQWTGAGFNHSFFPLVLGHSNITCTVCHTTGNYRDTKPDCYSCHQQNYAATTNPNHVTANFPTTCQVCHSLTPGWKPAIFDHSVFPLTLGHSGVDCSSCHINGNFTTTPTTCSSCHINDYNNTTNPSHKTLNFSLTCTDCHTTNPGWKPAKYAQHDSQYFPIYSGNHNGVWTSCTDCHDQPSSYALFSCTNCHEHSQANTDPHHREVRNYVYSATSCYTCHPKGRGGD
jgi:hypothetical protein